MKKSLLKSVFLGLTMSAMLVPCASKAELPAFLDQPDFNGSKPVWIVRAGTSFNSVVGSRKQVTIDHWNGQFKKGEINAAYSGKTGFDFSFGFTKSFGGRPLYWGMELGFGTFGYKYEASRFNVIDYTVSIGSAHNTFLRTQTQDLTGYNVRFSPFTMGYRYTFLQRMAADIHFGVYAAYEFAGTYKSNMNDKNDYNTSVGDNHVNKELFDSEIKIKDDDHMNKYDVGINLGIGYWFGPFNIDFSWQRGFVPMWDNGDDEVVIGQGKSKRTEKWGNYYNNTFQLKLGYAF